MFYSNCYSPNYYGQQQQQNFAMYQPMMPEMRSYSVTPSSYYYPSYQYQPAETQPIAPTKTKKSHKTFQSKSTQTVVKLVSVNGKKPPLPPALTRQQRPLSTGTSSIVSGVSSTSTVNSNLTKLTFLGVKRCDPIEYENKYSSSLVSSTKIPDYLNKIINKEEANFVRTLYKFNENGKIYKVY